jgi:ATP-binding cassette subfamily B protein
VLVAFAMAFGSLAADTLKPLAVRYGVDEGIAASDTQKLLLAGLLVLGLYAVRGVLAYGQNYASEFLSQHVAYDLRNDLYNRIQALSFSFHDKAQTGQLMSRVTVDVETSRQFLSNSLLNLVTTFARFIVIAAIVLNLNLQLALCILIALPVVAFISAKTAQALRPIWLAVQQQEGAYSAVLQETISGMRVVQSFTAEEREFENFQKANWAVRENSLEANRLAALRQPMLIFCMQAVLVVILAYGGTLVINGDMTVGTLLAFTQYSAQLTTPIRQIGALLNTSSRAVAAGERIFEILDTPSGIIDRPDAKPLGDGPGHVQFEEVGFGYSKDTMVLSGIDIDALPGQTVAVMGPVGSGKTTVLNLLPRFYDVSEGRITIDGTDIRDVTLDSLRANVGIVMQDVFLFSGTVRENIAYGRPSATEQEIFEAAKVARIHDFIETLPEGYETWVGERGITLSGGQKQRVSIARTLLMNPRILVLDDSTSSVDVETEYLIQLALADLLKGRTAFVIAHRLQTVRSADQIVVLKDGRIAEQGTHDSLIELGQIYRELYDLQLRDQEAVGHARTLQPAEEEAL